MTKETMRQWGICLLLAAGTFLVFSRVLSNGFIGFDDLEYILQNPYLKKGFSAENWNWIFSFYISNWFPLTWVSHLIDYQLYGLNPAGHHLTSLLLHCVNTVLLYLALKRMTKDTFRSLIVAALFALHPFRVESVAWVSERKDVLASFFALISMLEYYRYTQKSKMTAYVSSLGFFTLALMSKPMPISLFIVFLLLDYWPLRRLSSGWKVGLEKIPFAFVAIGSAWLTINAQALGRSVESLNQLPVDWRVSNAFISYLLYLWKTIIPYPLLPFYPHPAFDPAYSDHRNLFVIAGVVAGIVLAIATWFFLALRKQRPYLAVGWFWYIVMLIPVIGFIQVGTQGMADRYTYLPLAGIFIMAVWSIPDRFFEIAALRKMLAAAAACVLLLCAVLTWNYTGRWKDTETLFTYVLKKGQKNFMAHSVMGGHYAREGKWEEAEASYRNVLVYRPRYIDAYFNLIVSLKKLGKYKEAFSTLREMNTALASKNLPVISPQDPRYRELENIDRLVYRDLERLRENPGDPAIHKKLTNFLDEMSVPKGTLEQRLQTLFQTESYPHSAKLFRAIFSK